MKQWLHVRWFTVIYSFSSNFAACGATKQLVGRVLISGVVFAYCVTVGTLMAAEYHGTIKSGGLPIPGAVVTASQGDKKLTTATDEQGAYSFPDLSDGAWTISVEMFGFDKSSRQVIHCAGCGSGRVGSKIATFQPSGNRCCASKAGNSRVARSKRARQKPPLLRQKPPLRVERIPRGVIVASKQPTAVAERSSVSM